MKNINSYLKSSSIHFELVLLAKSYGSLKYFHPADATEKYLDELFKVLIEEVLSGKTFKYCWDHYLENVIVKASAVNSRDCVVWQHHGVGTNNEFYDNRVQEFLSIRTNRSYRTSIPLRHISKEVIGNYNGIKLKLEYEGNIKPFVFGLDMNGYLITTNNIDDAYIFESDTFGLYVGFELIDQVHKVNKLKLINTVSGFNLLSEINDKELKGWTLTTDCYKWDQETTSYVCQTKELKENQIILNLPPVSETLNIKISKNDSVKVPLCISRSDALISDTQKCFLKEALLSHNLDFDNSKILNIFDIIMFWNVIYLFHPYIDKFKNFGNALEEMLENELNEMDHKENLLKLGAKMKDGHFFPHFNQNIFHSDLFLVPYKDKVYIGNHCEGDFVGLEGKEVSEINGKNVNKLLSKKLEYVSSSPQRSKNLALFNLLSGHEGETFSLKTMDGKSIDGDFSRPFPPKPYFLPDSGICDKNILYIKLSAFTYEEMLELIIQSKDIKGIIFDNRYYPKGNHGILRHFMKDDLTSKDWCQKPLYVRPRDNGKISDEYLYSGWFMNPQTPFIDIPTCLLIDQSTQSYGESWVTMYQAINPNGIIGRSTSGANGDINFLTLATGTRISWSCRRIVDHFGEVYFSIGIQAFIEVEENSPGLTPSFENDNFIQAAIKYFK
jgi:hypothetical protein